jgi:hypothetical protein
MTTPTATVANPGSIQNMSLSELGRNTQDKCRHKFGHAADNINPLTIAMLPHIKLPQTKSIKSIRFSDLEGHPAVRGSFMDPVQKGYFIALRILVIFPVNDKSRVSEVKERIEILTHCRGKYEFIDSSIPRSDFFGSLLDTKPQKESFEAIKRLLDGEEISPPNKTADSKMVIKLAH